jgi:hypothetical protein
MKIHKFEDEKEWLEFRKAKILGTKLKDIIVKRGTGKKVGFYQLIADRLALDGDDENPMERGHRLEEEAIDLLTETTGVKFNKDLVIISRDDNPNIAYSPDGFTDDGKVSVEVKCLKSALHIQTIIEDKVPNEYIEQTVQPFIVNDDLEKLFFVSYDPRLITRPFHVIEINRSDVEAEISLWKEYEEKTLKEVDHWVEVLAW